MPATAEYCSGAQSGVLLAPPSRHALHVQEHACTTQAARVHTLWRAALANLWFESVSAFVISVIARAHALLCVALNSTLR
jgi:hypothetical protein